MTSDITKCKMYLNYVRMSTNDWKQLKIYMVTNFHSKRLWWYHSSKGKNVTVTSNMKSDIIRQPKSSFKWCSNANKWSNWAVNLYLLCRQAKYLPSGMFCYRTGYTSVWWICIFTYFHARITMVISELWYFDLLKD